MKSKEEIAKLQFGSKSALFAIPSKAFTLLEIMLVIAILGMVASVVGWQIASCVGRYAFQRDIEEVYNAIKQSQILCLTYQTDINVRFCCEDGVFYYRLQSDEPFTEIPFDREKKTLEKVGRITFNEKPVKQFDLSLYSQGNAEPRGILGFFPKDKKEESALWLDFQGAFLLSLSPQKPTALKERAPVFPEDSLKKFTPKKQENPISVPDPIKK